MATKFGQNKRKTNGQLSPEMDIKIRDKNNSKFHKISCPHRIICRRNVVSVS